MSLPDQSETPKAAPQVVDVDLYLRSKQVGYLEYLAERHDCHLSHAVGQIVGRARQTVDVETVRPQEKVRIHLVLDVTHLSFIDRLGVVWGIWRSDVVRRLIDDAMAKDQTI